MKSEEYSDLSARFLASVESTSSLNTFRAIYTAADDALCGDWKEETEEQYDDALNILPPAKWYSGGFYVPEAYTANIYSFHQRMNGRFYTSLQRSSTPRSAILESLAAWIKSNETKGAEQ